MVTNGTATSGTKLGSHARNLRLAGRLTQVTLAEISGVSKGDISLFERGLPVRLDSRRRILKALYAEKTGK